MDTMEDKRQVEEKNTKSEESFNSGSQPSDNEDTGERTLKIEPDKKDILAFVIALWQIFLPLILVFIFLFLAAIIILQGIS